MKKGFFYLLVLIVLMFGCKKNEELSFVPITDLYPLKAGKVFYYRLDSTVVSSNTLQLLTISYNAKDSVDSEFLDNVGRKSFRIFRYLRDTSRPLTDNSNWKYTATYYATLDQNRVEYIDNNLRFIALVNPVREGNQWKGTQYINTGGGSSNPLGFYDDWNFEYQHVGESFNVKKGIIQNTFHVLQNDDENPNVPVGTDKYQTRDFAEEVYANGIGLIYKNQLHWSYQPTLNGIPAHYETQSFGIRLSLIDYK